MSERFVQCFPGKELLPDFTNKLLLKKKHIDIDKNAKL